MPGHVVIVGGGLSGLVAGVRLSAAGIGVTLLEQKPALGGRAYSFTDSTTGETIDNGQHVLIAGYEHALRFLETIGTRELLRIQETPSLTFHHPDRGFHTLRLARLPVPLNLLVGVVRCGLFSVTDRLRLLRVGNALRRMSPREVDRLRHETVGGWLKRLGQSDECVRSLWEPLAVSIMNESTSSASALLFAQALRKAFLGGARHAALAIPSVGLSQLYVESARQYILVRGGKVQCGADVEAVLVEGGRARGVKPRDGLVVPADAVILTVPPHKLLSVLPTQLKEQMSRVSSIAMSPIVSIHLWFRTEFMTHQSVGLVGRRIQWLFNRRIISPGSEEGAHVSAVISGAHRYVDMTKDDLVKVAVEDIRAAYPSLNEEPWHSVVIREKSATYSSDPATEALRPPAGTDIPNLFLAGDWTATGYPATLEGAVVSAERAVEGVRGYLRL